MPADSNFGETVARFQKLLEHEGYPGRVVWVMPENVFLSGERLIYVHLPIPNTNDVKARQIFEEAMANGRGLLMSTLCELEDSTCCYLWYPKSRADEPRAQWPEDGRVKLSVKTNEARMPGKLIKGRLHWVFVKFRLREKQGLKHLLFDEGKGLITVRQTMV